MIFKRLLGMIIILAVIASGAPFITQIAAVSNGEDEIQVVVTAETFPIEGYNPTEEYGATCDFDWYGKGVWSDKSQYTPTENFIDYSRFINNGDTSEYTVYFRLYNPSGVLKWCSSDTGTLQGRYYTTWTVEWGPPLGGWEPGDWQFCSYVRPALCPDLAEMCCINNVAGVGIPDIWLDKASLNFAFTEAGTAVAQPIPVAGAATPDKSVAVYETCSGVSREAAVLEEELLQAVCEAIEEEGAQWEADITSVSGLSLEAKKRLCGLNLSPLPKDMGTVTLSLEALPSAFDWRDKDGVDWMTSVKEQICGTCWCFGTLGSLEAVINIDNNDPNIDMDLSEQRILSCCPNITLSCSGGDPGDACYCLQNHGGTPNEACFPYGCPAAGCPESGISCDVCPDWADKAWQITSYTQVSPDTTEAYKAALIEYGPLGVAMRVPDDFFFYAGGIYEPVRESEEWAETFPYGQANHWVTLVGYDDAGGYWIVKNSWSADWGEQGYGKILYGDIEKYAHVIAIVSIAGPDNCKAITVYNEGNASLNVDDVTISYGGDEPTGWLDAERKSFSLSPHRSEGITAWVDTTGLSPSEYHATLNIYSDDPDENPAYVAVTLTIGGPNTPPQVTSVTASQGSPTVDITYDVSDAEQSDVAISFEYWNGSSWQACTTTTGEGAQSIGTGKSGTWDAKANFDGHYMTDCKIKVTADDEQTENNIGTGESSSFTLDTKDPTGYGCSSPANGATNISVNPNLTCLAASDDSPPVSYYFQLAENDTFDQGLQESGWQQPTNWTPTTALSYGTAYWWRVKARDAKNNEGAWSPPFTFVTIYKFALALKSGWNMISLPLESCTGETNPGVILPDVEVIYTWNCGTTSYDSPSEIIPGKGYWALVFEDVTKTIYGTPVEEYQLSSDCEGWHMVGALYVDGQVNVNSGSVYGSLYHWNPETLTYIARPLDDVRPGEGYWLLAFTNFSISVIPEPPAP